MKVERKSDHAVSEDSCKTATGKSLAEWFGARHSTDSRRDSKQADSRRAGTC
jgi:hypothetical protein